MGMDRRAAELIRRHAVALFAGSTFQGSGFLVDPGTVLTCAHVVAGKDKPIRVRWSDQEVGADCRDMLPRDAGAGDFYSFPDLALLTLHSPFVDTPAGVWLADCPPDEGAIVVAYGFSRYTPEAGVAADTLRLVITGAAGNFLRVSGDRVVPGMSGSLVLDEEIGQVCGIVKASRDPKEVQGGWIIPVTAVAEGFPDITEHSARIHRPGIPWFDLVRNREGLQTGIFGRSASGKAKTPAGLLVATQGTVPFVPRSELSALHDWCEQRDAAQGIVRLIYAPGGAGKTRLARQLCADMQERGWLAGFLPSSDTYERYRLIVEGLTAGFPVLLVIDYAQDRLSQLQNLLTYLTDQIPETAPVRILLLARADQPWWEALHGQLGAAGDWALHRAHTVELKPLTETNDAGDLADDAFRAFTKHLNGSANDPPTGLRAEARQHQSILAIHALALDAALTGRAWDSWKYDDPLIRICDHEVRIWRTRLNYFSSTDLAAEILPEAVLLVPTLAPGQDRARTVNLLGEVIRLFPRVAGKVDPESVWQALHDLYATGSETLTTIEPDRVAEVLVRRLFRALPPGTGGRYLNTLLAGNALPGLHVLARARGCTAAGHVVADAAYETLDKGLRDLISSRPAAMVPAMVQTGAVLPHAEPIADVLTGMVEECDIAILAAVEPLLPRHRTGLSGFAARVYQRLLAEQIDGSDDTGQLRRVHLLTQLSLRLSEIERPAEAIEIATEAMVISGDLARRSDDYCSEYAASLNNLSIRLAGVGEVQHALGRSIEAEENYRALAADSTPDHRTELAATLSNQALLRSKAGHPAAAVEAAQEAITLLKAAPKGPRQELMLAQALVNLSLVLMDIGETGLAVDAARQAVELYRDLAERQPSRHLLDLLDALQLLAIELENHDQADSLRMAYAALSEAARRRQPFIAERNSLRDKQRHALRLLRDWSVMMPESEAEGADWIRTLKSI